jgi:ATP-dependent Lon protease
MSRIGTILFVYHHGIPMASDPEQNDPTPADVPRTLPLIPLRDVVIFPYMIFPILVGRESSIRAVTDAIERDKYLFVAAQMDPEVEDPAPGDLYAQGTVARILQVLKLPNGLLKVLVDGLFHAVIEVVTTSDHEYLTATFRIVEPKPRKNTELRALMRQLDSVFGEYVRTHRDIPNETLLGYDSADEPARKLYFVAANMLVDVATRQSVLAIEDTVEQYYRCIRVLTDELAVLKVEQEIDEKVNETIQKGQRRYFIQEQIRVLQRELGEEEEDGDEYSELHRRIEQSGMPQDVLEKALEELGKLRKTSPMSPEATVTRNYLDWLLAMPWTTVTEDNLSVANARTVLNRDHYGLEKPKDRILDHIAVLNLVREMRGPILCFVGPPGVGKTSLGKSIARALGRNFARIALGGIHDEGEIRGHRRTYIGSMPGKIVHAIRRAGSMNPVILLDEIDKMSRDFQGDPTSAMLEVLDPEQNHTFNDHYLDTDFDLSKVMFITTANVQHNIPLPLQDRMEIIELPGYLEHEKLEIARRHLIPRQIEEHGLKPFGVSFTVPAVQRIIRDYTLEAGVRNLERSAATVCRKLARDIVGSGVRPKKSVVDEAAVERHLGVPRYRQRRVDRAGRIGAVTGLAWTSAGGDILEVGVTMMSGQEKLTLTGQLGDVMKESAQAALSYLRSNAARLGVAADAFVKKEVHIHLPEGAIPKDGPSAGITMTMAMLSLLTGRIPRADTAMTGEITLHGDVLAIGGLNEKLLAARRHGFTHVLIPKDNEKDLAEIPKKITTGLRIHPVASIDEAIPLVFDAARKSARKVPAKGAR